MPGRLLPLGTEAGFIFHLGREAARGAIVKTPLKGLQTLSRKNGLLKERQELFCTQIWVFPELYSFLHCEEGTSWTSINLYPNCSQKRHTGSTFGNCYCHWNILLPRLLLWAESLQEQVSSSMKKKKKKTLPKLQPREGQRKRGWTCTTTHLQHAENSMKATTN